MSRIDKFNIFDTNLSNADYDYLINEKFLIKADIDLLEELEKQAIKDRKQTLKDLHNKLLFEGTNEAPGIGDS
jgi:DNA-binding protein YbaB